MPTAIQLTHTTNGFLPMADDSVNNFLAVTNSGTDVISSVTIASRLGIIYTEITNFDPVQGLDFNIGDSNNNGIFEIGERWYYSGVYLVSQADLDSDGGTDGTADGAISNTITVSASGPGGSVTRENTVSFAVGSERAGISIRQSATPEPARAGDTLRFAVDVRNSGNRDLYDLSLTGSPFATPTALGDANGFNSGDSDQDAIFDVGETWHFTSSHAVSQADIDNQGALDGSADGALTYTVTALANLCGEGCSALDEQVSASNAITVPLASAPPLVAAIDLVATARIDAIPSCDDEHHHSCDDGHGDRDRCDRDRDRCGHDDDSCDDDHGPHRRDGKASTRAGRAILGGIDLGGLTDYLFVFADGRVEANWQGASGGFVGDVAVDGKQARERTSGSVSFAGTLLSNDKTAGGWLSLLRRNEDRARFLGSQGDRIAALEKDLVSAIQTIGALQATPTTSVGGRNVAFGNLAASALNGLNTQDGIGQTFVINVTSGFSVKERIAITGDANDVFVLRWDSDRNAANGYQGQVAFQNGGGIVPRGALTAGNFIHVAGDISSARGGLFTGYWLTTGAPSTTPDPLTGLATGASSALSKASFVGGWYTLSTQINLSTGSSGLHVAPNSCALQPLAPDQQTDAVFDPSRVGSATATLTLTDDDDDGDDEPSHGVTTTFRVSNSGTDVLTNLRLIADNGTPALPSDDYAPTPVRKANGGNFGDGNDNLLLDPGETWYYQSKRILGSCSGTLTNTATVSADALGLGSRVQDTASAIVQVLPPGESGCSGWR
ncbi:MAG: hypothetical protein VKJ05_04355 [Synechococcaceae cyanobacterium]|nr:hypothetical protein [Synechococcaceae cyanobacterium]